MHNRKHNRSHKRKASTKKSRSGFVMKTIKRQLPRVRSGVESVGSTITKGAKGLWPNIQRTLRNIFMGSKKTKMRSSSRRRSRH